MPSPRRYILSLSCPDRVGIVAAVSSFLAQRNVSILDAKHHSDPESNRFFMRHEVDADSCALSIDELRREFDPIRKQFDMRCTIAASNELKRVVILVSRQAHCLDDLLYRLRSGEMRFDLRAVISNHDDSRAFVEWHKVPFHHVPVDESNKQKSFDEVDRIIDREKPDAIVLARYMQILPPNMCEKYANRILNIHHSFLPSFVGAKPYHQAHQRGVKYVGATCHYVTNKLDDGPIIEQDAFRTNHADTIEEVIRTGRDIERAVLARGLRYHLEDRVLMNGNKTVVFD